MVEVPVSSRAEYEPEVRAFVRDRALPSNVRFPAGYGFVPSTACAGGELLGALVLGGARFEDVHALEDLPEPYRREAGQFYVAFRRLEGAREIIRKSAS